jgi:hypothetical protein
MVELLPQGLKAGEKLSKETVAKISVENLNIVASDWGDLLTISAGLKRIELNKAKEICIFRAAKSTSKAANRKFWNAMAERYEAMLKK